MHERRIGTVFVVTCFESEMSADFPIMPSIFLSMTESGTTFREQDDAVIMSGHFEGTFTNDFNLEAMGIGVVPATGKKIVWHPMSVRNKVEGGKITREAPYGDTGGLEDMLTSLGVSLASA